jgi:hypothetical protein
MGNSFRVSCYQKVRVNKEKNQASASAVWSYILQLLPLTF